MKQLMLKGVLAMALLAGSTGFSDDVVARASKINDEGVALLQAKDYT